MIEGNKFNVIFLVDKNPATKVVLLKRSPDKSYAPNFFTGIGGKIGDLPGLENETPIESAYRELAEETENQLNEDTTKLQEFARCIYDDSGMRLYYFWGLHSDDSVPHIDPKDGTLVWVDTKGLLEKDIIPTTKEICEEWAKRAFSVDQPFSVSVKEVGKERTVRLVETINITEGLS